MGELVGLEKFLDLLIIRVRKGRGEEVSERKGWQAVLAEVHLGTQGGSNRVSHIAGRFFTV